MARDEERRARSKEDPIVGGLPDFPGILVAMRLSPHLGAPLRALADALLVEPFPGSTLTRAERELIATATSAGNDCFYCMDSHGAFAAELLAREQKHTNAIATLVDAVKVGESEGLDARMKALLHIARVVQKRSRDVSRADVTRATTAGASDGDVQLAILIASAFCMYNRMVDGLRAKTPESPAAFEARAKEIAEHGYSDARVVSVPK